MSDPLTVLLVDDDDFAAEVTAELLQTDYRVIRKLSGQEALAHMDESGADLVLLDVDMPGMSGYEVCRTLRQNANIVELPVLFLSGKTSDDDRLAGYEAGGDDYLTKPVCAEELRSKIKHAVAHHEDRKQLQQNLSQAFSTAMTAMTSAAEIGAVLQFLHKSYACQDYASLCQEVLSTLGSYGLEASVKIYGEQGAVSFSPGGPCSPLEESVLNHMQRQGRLFEFGARISCSYEHITVIVKSDAKADPERHGRMRDNLALLAEGANSRVIALDNEIMVAKQKVALAQLSASIRKTLQEIDQRHQVQAKKNRQVFVDLQASFDRALLSLGVTTSQEEELAAILEVAARQAQALYDEGLETDEHMAGILKLLEWLGQK